MVMTGLWVFGLCALLLGATVLALRGNSRTQSLGRRISLLLATISLLLFLGEFLLAFVFVFSDGWAVTLSSDLWGHYYWHPVNSEGYRDVEHLETDFTDKRTVFVIGDSFVAGDGIEDYRDRFSNLLQSKLGDSWTIVNMARSGWSSKHEFRALRQSPHLPEFIILSYYLNDIKNAAAKVGNPMSEDIHVPTGTWGKLLRQSYVLDFLYWRTYRSVMSSEMDRWWGEVERTYTDPQVWAEHRTELLRFVVFSRRNKCKLIVVIFPELSAVGRSRPYTTKVAQLLRKEGVQVIDMTEKLDGRNPKELVVNAIDSHPSKQVHREVADLLLPHLVNK